MSIDTAIPFLKQAQDSISRVFIELAASVPVPTPIPTPAPSTDYSIKPPPSVASPLKGVWWKDPTFGADILKITGGLSTAPSWRTQSAGYCWSADSKMFTIIDMWQVPHLYKWDGNVATYVRPLPFGMDAVFDPTDPNIVYGIGYNGDQGVATVKQHNISAQQTFDVVSVRDIVPSVDAAYRTYARGLGIRGGKLTLMFGGGSQDSDFYTYQAPLATPKVGMLINTLDTFGIYLHSQVVDLSGRYLSLGIRGGDIVKYGAPQIVWDLQTGLFTPMKTSAGGHGAWGPMVYINNPDDEDSMEYRWRSLAQPNVVVKLVTSYPTPGMFSQDSHQTWVQPRGSVISARFRYLDGVKLPYRAFDDEMIEVSSNPGAPIKRICHHQSFVTSPVTATDQDYWSEPKPAASPDGTATLFTSNWRRLLGTNSDGPRQDVFVVRT